MFWVHHSALHFLPRVTPKDSLTYSPKFFQLPDDHRWWFECRFPGELRALLSSSAPSDGPVQCHYSRLNTKMFVILSCCWLTINLEGPMYVFSDREHWPQTWRSSSKSEMNKSQVTGTRRCAFNLGFLKNDVERWTQSITYIIKMLLCKTVLFRWLICLSLNQFPLTAGINGEISKPARRIKYWCIDHKPHWQAGGVLFCQ